MAALTKWRTRHEDSGYILQRNAPLTRATVARLRMRRGHMIFKWVKGHSGHPGNDAADKLAAIGSEKAVGESLSGSLTIPPALRLSGAKLQAVTQKLAYRAIRTRRDKEVDPRPRTVANLDRITSGIQAAYGVSLCDETIWKSFRSRHVSREASQYLWMATHDAYMIGSHWLRPNMSDELRDREICKICGERESMTHIVFECEAIGQQTIWRLLQQTWELTGEEWKPPSWGTTFGAACAVFKASGGSRKTHVESLWCIMCIEALHLIWKLRCERIIRNEGAQFTENEVVNRFYATMESRLNLDRRTAAVSKKGKKALRPQEVEMIWMPVIEKGNELPLKWVVDCGVLVGIKRGR
ncbi:hypothetical protein K466DRAFT_615478 [Polyporus arcularius HHB13444]|uniref:RNase H type-1 domain-containing protein n=1 Tax=Polyporus arcularius HHB13444 TaxID=1314778 RepID=A0A5C3NM18_9APHY|nr:hypothetical protein K466DRAFT_615478 [Polyporus arcularius HHB13444]